MRVKHVPQASGPGAYHTPRRCEYCWIRANVVEGSFRLEIVQHSGSFLFKDLTKRESIDTMLVRWFPKPAAVGKLLFHKPKRFTMEEQAYDNRSDPA